MKAQLPSLVAAAFVGGGIVAGLGMWTKAADKASVRLPVPAESLERDTQDRGPYRGPNSREIAKVVQQAVEHEFDKRERLAGSGGGDAEGGLREASDEASPRPPSPARIAAEQVVVEAIERGTWDSGAREELRSTMMDMTHEERDLVSLQVVQAIRRKELEAEVHPIF